MEESQTSPREEHVVDLFMQNITWNFLYEQCSRNEIKYLSPILLRSILLQRVSCLITTIKNLGKGLWLCLLLTHHIHAEMKNAAEVKNAIQIRKAIHAIQMKK